jgi:hypothetical protein
MMAAFAKLVLSHRLRTTGEKYRMMPISFYFWDRAFFMSVTCLNCGTQVQDQFCPHCGQKITVKKLTWYSLVEEILHFFSHIEHGFLNTSYQLLIRPGRVIKEYLHGKRKKYHKPVSLYLIWAGIRLLTFTLVSTLMHYDNFRTGNLLFGSREAGVYVVQHTQAFGLLSIPIVALFVWLIISRPKINYIETLTMSIYFYAIIEMLIMLQLFITGLLLRTNFLTDGFSIQVQCVYTAWAFFAMIDLFKKDKIKLLPLRAVLSLIIAFFVFQIAAGQIAGLILKLKH